MQLVLFENMDINIVEVFLLVVLMGKLMPWETRKVQDERSSWETPMKPI